MRAMIIRYLAQKLLVVAFLLSGLSCFGDDAETKKDMSEFEPKPGVEAIDPAKFSKAPTLPNRSEPPWQTGIIESGLAPFPSAFYKIENQWHEILDGEHVKVYVGAAGKDPSQGVVVVQVTTLDLTNTTTPEVFKTSIPVGALRIVAAKGPQLTLSSSEGLRFSFDVQSRKLDELPKQG